jgi:hypothetical protein
MSRVAEILEINVELIKNKEMKLLVGDMEMCFSRLKDYVNHGLSFTNDKMFYQCYGEVSTFLYCLYRMGVFTEEQVWTMKSVLKELEQKQTRAILKKGIGR